MNSLYSSRMPLVLLTLVVLSAAPVRLQTRQSAANSALFQTVASLDRELFGAYNTCNLERFGSLLAEDIEFFHDKGGVTRGRPALVESVRNNICGKTRRDLVSGSLEVHPMDGYGVLQWRPSLLRREGEAL